ncbi:MAG: NUDIX domain-containing protein [Gammaproteobacteria bacterium]|nr:NUDIX domain-containing protein [Gammaproteobacteria bacterium]
MNDNEKQWQLDSRSNVFDGFYRLDKVEFKHTLYNGGWTSTIDREMIHRGNVTAVLPYDPKLNAVALVEQFRIGAMNQESPWLWEVIAGMMDKPGEAPEEVAKREALEEAGLELQKLSLIAHYLASPGSTTEEVFIFFAETDLSSAGGVYGLAEENEDILVKVIPADKAIEMLDNRTICNAISIIAMQWFKGYQNAR